MHYTDVFVCFAHLRSFAAVSHA